MLDPLREALVGQELGPRSDGGFGALDDKRSLISEELGPLNNDGFGDVENIVLLATRLDVETMRCSPRPDKDSHVIPRDVC